MRCEHSEPRANTADVEPLKRRGLLGSLWRLLVRLLDLQVAPRLEKAYALEEQQGADARSKIYKKKSTKNIKDNQQTSLRRLSG